MRKRRQETRDSLKTFLKTSFFMRKETANKILRKQGWKWNFEQSNLCPNLTFLLRFFSLSYFCCCSLCYMDVYRMHIKIPSSKNEKHWFLSSDRKCTWKWERKFMFFHKYKQEIIDEMSQVQFMMKKLFLLY